MRRQEKQEKQEKVITEWKRRDRDNRAKKEVTKKKKNKLANM
jgi:hypothetical protein